jgi:hypothetical protein
LVDLTDAKKATQAQKGASGRAGAFLTEVITQRRCQLFAERGAIALDEQKDGFSRVRLQTLLAVIGRRAPPSTRIRGMSRPGRRFGRIRVADADVDAPRAGVGFSARSPCGQENRCRRNSPAGALIDHAESYDR